MTGAPDLEAVRAVARRLGLRGAADVAVVRAPTSALVAALVYGDPPLLPHPSRAVRYARILAASRGRHPLLEVVPLGGRRLLLDDALGPPEAAVALAHGLGHVDFSRRNRHLAPLGPLVARRLTCFGRVRRSVDPDALALFLDQLFPIARHVRPPGRAGRHPADLLGAVLDGAPLSPWQRTIGRLLWQEALAAHLLEATEVANEGWATFWEETILDALDLGGAATLRWARLKARQLAGAPAHALGRAVFRTLGALHGPEAVVTAAATADDAALLLWLPRRGPAAELGRRLEEHLERRRRAEVALEVEEASPGRPLRLRHRHDGRPLDRAAAEAALERLAALWGDEVRLATWAPGGAVSLSARPPDRRPGEPPPDSAARTRRPPSVPADGRPQAPWGEVPPGGWPA